MVYDPTLVKSLAAMTAAQWFATREQLANDFPTGFDVRRWELVPGEQVDVRPLPFGRSGLALFLFANYPGAGDHRARLDVHRQARVTLGEKTLTVAADR